MPRGACPSCPDRPSTFPRALAGTEAREGGGGVWVFVVVRFRVTPTALASLRSTFTCDTHGILTAILGGQERKLRHRAAK